MSRFALAPIVLCAVLLAACGGGGEEAPAEAAATAPAAPAPTPPAEPAGPQPIEGYDWTWHEPEAGSPDRASLSYSKADSADVPLWLNCDRGSGRVEAATDSPLMGVGAIILGSGEARAMYRVTTRAPSDFSGGEFLTTEVPLMDGPLQAFRQSGWINLSVAGQARDLAATPGPGREAITQFFSFCAPAPAQTQAPTPAADATASAAPATPG